MVGGLLREIFGTLIVGSAISFFTNKKMSLLMHQQNSTDILAIAQLIERGAIKCCIDKTFALDEIQQAFRYFREQKALGKIVITMKDQ